MTSSEQPSSGSGHTQHGSGSNQGSDSESVQGSSGRLTIEWGGKTVGQAPTRIAKGKPVTVTYDKTVNRATITIDGPNHETKPFTQAVKFPENVQQGDIQVQVHQDEQNPRKVTLTLVKAPDQKGGSGSGSGGQDGSNGPTGSEGGTQGTGNTTEDRTGPQHHGGTGNSGQQDSTSSSSGSSGAGLPIDWGGQVDTNAPKTLSKGKPATATYANSVTKATITVDTADDKDHTKAWTEQVKFGEAQQEEIHAELQQDPADPRKVTVKAVQWPAKATKLTVHWGGKTTTGQDSGSGSTGQGSQQGKSGGGDGSQQSPSGQGQQEKQ